MFTCTCDVYTLYKVYMFLCKNVCFISCAGHQLYERGVDLEVEGVRYIEMHHGPTACVLGLSRRIWSCHRNFGPGNFGPGDQNFQWKIGPAGPIFLGKNGPPLENWSE